eukprot:CAMPEP_0197851702 /NCGR_PEP_ID=MMETSP1438-20131217/18651_1 /TAXON_ID=1461541 /ORGANISM="Pterosperma sp., Strain CCMP1384" /LENGTH=429 /DNA_ID=CAMNT_0043465407 /DNA_START=241 /DNA_END=1530 /DNA_ORIENTATION=+
MASQTSPGPKEVEVQVLAPLRQAILNRPKALNSLNLNMVKELRKLFAEWEVQSHINTILVKGGPKAFCAGGDVKGVIQDVAAGKKSEGLQFFREEYKMNWEIKNLATPYVAMIDGITMGGGCGLSLHGGFRVCTERTVLAMPECAIGFFPDVGGSHFLSKLENNLGPMLALTGYRLKGLDVLMSGLATHMIPSDLSIAVEKRLQFQCGHALTDVSHTDGITRVIDPGQMVHDTLVSFQPLSAFKTEIPDDSVFLHINEIDQVYGAKTVEEIIAGIHNQIQLAEEYPNPHYRDIKKKFWEGQLAGINKGSPLALKVTLEQLRRAGEANMDLRECLIMEYRMLQHFLDGPTFKEGVRAVLIDKDQSPRWEPATLEEVTDEMVAKYFEPAEEELELPLAKDILRGQAAYKEWYRKRFIENEDADAEQQRARL